MKTKAVGSIMETGAGVAGFIRTIFLALTVFVVGIVVAVYWVQRAPHSTGKISASQNVVLSDSTRAVLGALHSPLEIRFYFPKDNSHAPEAICDFAARIERLLAGYESVGNGMLRVTRLHPELDTVAEAQAKSDGIRPAFFGSGDPYYFGLVIVQGEQKETIGPLSPEWEAALEFDLSRAIARADSVVLPSAQFASDSPTSAQAEAEIRSNPKLASVSVDEGSQILRQTALLDVKSIVNEMQVKIDAAREKLMTAQKSGTEVEQKKALQALRELQAEQTAKMNEVGQKLQDQLAALQRVKTVVQ